MKTALITGVTGQDGSYLVELLLSEGYQVHGLVRRSSVTSRPRLDHLFLDSAIYEQRLFLHYADLTDATTIRRTINKLRPDELYHLAGQSHVGASYEIPESTCEFTAMGTLRLLEILRDCEPRPRVLHISSSEIFGNPESAPQDALTPMRPVSPYGVAKAFATNMVRVYRESFDFFACNAICYNHESPRRGESFVTRKIARAAAQIKQGQQNQLMLGNLEARRDWGFAGDYVRAMWLMLQQEEPSDFVIASGLTHSIQDFLSIAFSHVGLDWTKYVKTDMRYMRPTDSTTLIGDPSKAEQQLGWKRSVNFEELVTSMVDAELNLNG